MVGGGLLTILEICCCCCCCCCACCCWAAATCCCTWCWICCCWCWCCCCWKSSGCGSKWGRIMVVVVCFLIDFYNPSFRGAKKNNKLNLLHFSRFFTIKAGATPASPAAGCCRNKIPVPLQKLLNNLCLITYSSSLSLSSPSRGKSVGKRQNFFRFLQIFDRGFTTPKETRFSSLSGTPRTEN